MTDSAISLLSDHFKRSVTVIVARQLFRHRAQHAGEAVEEYIAALQALIAECNFGSPTDETLRDQLVPKTTNNHLLERLLFEGSSLILSRALTTANQYELAVSQAKEFCDDASVHHVKKAQSFAQPSEQADEHVRCDMCQAKAYEHPKGAMNLRACYRCGATEHLENSPACKARKCRCRLCAKIRHLDFMCKSSGHSAKVRQVHDDDSSSYGSEKNNLCCQGAQTRHLRVRLRGRSGDLVSG